ncbi:AraC family transcriptional regulator [Methanohalophilus halophilus]|uniref:Transcriptional regulator n=1 Tax=Methanohalophilus halophilus TaxID=2177 RepID=A0A1L3Q506_9EURY|nr:GyrI-like domain-containing protein [Methanohalophilus halophilus]APH39960.1 transcriptional regulator [Methanohalophilus halophilus]RNI07772.1 AraC family transcriptional regulator [Methanohalophilus halophilus]
MEIIKEPVITELDERNVACVSFVGNYVGDASVFEELFGKLFSWAGPKQLMGPDTLLMSAYYDDPAVTPPEELKVDVCMTIEDDVEVEGEIKKKKLPGGKYVVMRVELAGAEEYGPVWEKIVGWVMQKNFEIDISRASYEIYLNSPEEHPQGHHILDICMAVK